MEFLVLHALVDVSNTYIAPMGLPVAGLRPANTYSPLPTTAPSISPIGVGSGTAMVHPLCAPSQGVPASANIARRKKAFDVTCSARPHTLCTIQQRTEGRPPARPGAHSQGVGAP